MKTPCLVVIAALVAGQLCAAPPPKAVRKAHADRNKDGVVTPREIKAEKRWETRQKSKVNTSWEAKADANDDGRVDRKEAAVAHKGYVRRLSVVDRPWEKAADANNDGQVELRELRVYHVKNLDANGDGRITVLERRRYWGSKKSVVNTEVEKKYDTDGNGYLSWDEGRELLRDRLKVINTDGQALVNTDLEMEFDVNGDGVMDRAEAPALKAALAEQGVCSQMAAWPATRGGRAAAGAQAAPGRDPR